MAATSTASMGSMGMDMGGGCKISMLWNWYTIDSCFLTESWHIRSSGMFAGSCIGVILLVMVLELLRRTAKEYDAYLIKLHSKSSDVDVVVPGSSSSNGVSVNKPSTALTPLIPNATVLVPQHFTPSILEQAIRAALHMAQFAIAYIIMLLAMYFNGYIIISIFIGAFLGFFVFNWTRITLKAEDTNPTYCCG